MRTCTLGSGGPTVAAVGAGDVSLATAAARGFDASDVARVLSAVLEAGLDLIDVAAEDDSERLAGETVRTLRLRDRAIVACQVPRLSERGLPGGYVQQRVEASLRATRLDGLPLVVLPLRAAWRGSKEWPELVGTCARLVREGKVLRWGASIDPRDLVAGAPKPVKDEHSWARGDVPQDLPPGPLVATELLEEPWLCALAVPFNACSREAEPLVAAAREKSVAVLARQPLAGGALAGALGPGVRLRPRDDRNSIDPATLEKIAVGVARLAGLVTRTPPAARATEAGKQLLETLRRPDDVACATLAEAALRFVIDRGALALPRLHRREHVPEALLAVGSAPLPSTAEQIFSTLVDGEASGHRQPG